MIHSGAAFSLLTDDETFRWLLGHTHYLEAEAKQLVAGYRRGAREKAVADEVKIHAEAWPGITFKQHIPLLGPCWKDFQYIQDPKVWDFPDPPTEHCLISWIPVPLATGRDATDDALVVTSMKNTLGLGDKHIVSSGLTVHLAGMLFAHYQATGQVVFGDRIIHTHTCFADGRRIGLNWQWEKLACWSWDGVRCGNRAVFLLGVTKSLLSVIF